MKHMTLKDFLTDAQIAECVTIAQEPDPSEPSLARRICARVIEPNLAEINRKLGQENDPRYLGYLIEYALTRAAAS
jgi:hypothetical protein